MILFIQDNCFNQVGVLFCKKIFFDVCFVVILSVLCLPSVSAIIRLCTLEENISSLSSAAPHMGEVRLSPEFLLQHS